VDLIALFPEKDTDRPNLHASLHLPELLLKYGPVHAWWAYPFECLIGHIQQLNTNYIIGVFFLRFLAINHAAQSFGGCYFEDELENTMIDTFLTTSNP
jgi:hypothetical protein